MIWWLLVGLVLAAIVVDAVLSKQYLDKEDQE